MPCNMETPDQVVDISTCYLCYQKMLTKPSNFKECDKKLGQMSLIGKYLLEK